MKTTMNYFLAAICFAGILAVANAQPAPDDASTNAAPELPPNGPPPDMPEPPPSPEALAAAASAAETTDTKPHESTVILPTEALGTSRAALNSDFLPPLTGTNANALLMNFRNAPLEMVLNYLSDAAGFIIVLDTQVRGNVSVISNHPLTKDEAVDLLNSVLNKNGYAAIRDGRTLTIVGKDDAKTRNIPVKVESNPKNIPNNDEIVTQIIPIRFVEAEQLTKDLSPFVSSQATIVANEAGNSIVITDTQSNIRHLAEIIQAIDNSAEAETEIRVFHLKYANPTDVATELGSIFPSSSSGNGTQAPTRFAGGGGGNPFARMFGGGGPFGGGGQAASSGGSNDRIKKATQVTAVADARIQAVIVTGPKDLMEQIAGMMKDLDVASDRDQNVSVISLQNGDPQQVAQVLQSMFSNGSTSRSGSSSSSQSSALQTRAQNSATSMSTTTTSSGIGSSTGGGGGGGGGRGGGQF